MDDAEYLIGNLKWPALNRDGVWESKRYRDWVRTLPCLVPACAETPSEPHHIVHKRRGGSDLMCAPICHVHHREWHRTTIEKFEAKHHIDVRQIILRTLECYIDTHHSR